MQPEEYENTGWLSYFSRHKTTYTAADIHKISNELNNVRKNLTATQYAYGELSSELKALRSLQEHRASEEYERSNCKSSTSKTAEKRLAQQAEEIKILRNELTGCKNELLKQINALKVNVSETAKKKLKTGQLPTGASLSIESRIIALEAQLEQLIGENRNRINCLEDRFNLLEQQHERECGHNLKKLELSTNRKFQELTNLVLELQRKMDGSETKLDEQIRNQSMNQDAIYEELDQRMDVFSSKLRELHARIAHIGHRDDIGSTFV
ncbi:uncharacterized protein LOC129777496 isoform X1 [Toxorhynchites rutilus septentrionalis]|uniref:uncharacterized protein LOC129777496 isoform X1 n=1 Tax=Toxorhynchites rutilus septentrionalis TaxID=329112 RepID=UPI0024791166|nr:uncharacterized protein LOC129777496 isoform X1 [Toxorhynchites rutilus septentrionalis]